jgi:riboflavin kinase/FMN adenylyltransferase
MPAVFLNRTDERPDGFTGSAVAIGNFDGVHRGHRALIDATIRWAKQLGGPAIAVSFDPPPYQVLFPQASVRPPLTMLEDRTQLLLEAGMHRVAILRTTPELLALTPEEFFHDVIRRQLGAAAVVEGFNFRFGINRTGNTNTLRTLCSATEMRFEEISPFVLGGESVSSSRVRATLIAGEVATAAMLLGRNYTISGTVVKGAERGRTLGFPTANLADVPVELPGNGVYAVRAIVNGTAWPAAANIGPNPTFGENARKVEVHLIGFTGDLYGTRLKVEFVKKLRDTRPFAGIAELTEQLKQDIVAARGVLA